MLDAKLQAIRGILEDTSAVLVRDPRAYRALKNDGTKHLGKLVLHDRRGTRLMLLMVLVHG
jgi:hypothetical protein